MQLEVCANCEEVIDHTPVYTDGQSFCCTGCGAGGPCACTYLDDAEVDGEDSSDLQPAGLASLLRFPRPHDRLVVVQISGFTDQRQIIRLAESMETSPALLDVTLACLADSDAWLTVHAASADAVAEVMTKVPKDEGSLDIIVNQNLVEARLVLPQQDSLPPHLDDTPSNDVPFGPLNTAPAPTPPRSQPWSIEQSPVEAPHQYMSIDEQEESVLPPRPRFRVFRPTPAEISSDSTVVDADAYVATPPSSMFELPEDDSEPGEVQYYIVATQPFRAFSAVNGYHAALRTLDGVKSTHVQRFDRGTLYLAVSYQSRVPLRARLEQLDGYTLEVLNETHSKIDVALRSAPTPSRTTASSHAMKLAGMDHTA